jgi:hypothetical protein
MNEVKVKLEDKHSLFLDKLLKITKENMNNIIWYENDKGEYYFTDNDLIVYIFKKGLNNYSCKMTNKNNPNTSYIFDSSLSNKCKSLFKIIKIKKQEIDEFIDNFLKETE